MISKTIKQQVRVASRKWVVNVNAHKGPFVYIGRGSIWGNPFIVGRDGNRQEVIRKYYDWIVASHDLREQLEELRGQYLGCYCSPKACHGDVLCYFLYVKSLKGVK